MTVTPIKVSAAVLVAAAITASQPVFAAAPATGLFQTSEQKSSKMTAFTKWNQAVRRFRREQRRYANAPAMRRWKAFINRSRSLSRLAQLRAVQRFVNSFTYRTDQRNYGQSDYWASPKQFFARGGDCEDFAIVKYMSLRALGWSVRSLRLVVLKDQQLRQGHAVLAVFYKGRRYILDNQFKSVMRDTQIRHYRPVYSINERHWWYHEAL